MPQVPLFNNGNIIILSHDWYKMVHNMYTIYSC